MKYIEIKAFKAKIEGFNGALGWNVSQWVPGEMCDKLDNSMIFSPEIKVTH